MQPSSTLCRAQEARQHALAAGTTLANVKGVAMLAAAAWAKEAALAEKREQRVLLRADREALIELPTQLPRSDDHWGSENPDRGLAG
jgi:hypothetical protein